MKFILFKIVGVLIAACFFCIYLNGQKVYNDSNKKYAEKYTISLEPGEKIKKSWYHYVVTQKSDGHQVVRVFFPETKQLTELMTFKSKKKKVLDGLFENWWDDGTPRDSGVYVHNIAEGTWRLSNIRGEMSAGKKIGLWQTVKNGMLRESGMYADGKMTGQWIYQDSLENIKSKFSYVDGLKSGPFMVYDSTGAIINEGTYLAGELIEESKIKDPEEIIEVVERMPIMSSCSHIEDDKMRSKCSNKIMLNHVYGDLKYPKDARKLGIEGNALFQFVIDKSGDVTNLKTLKGVCESIEKECIRVINNLPAWDPGIQDGKPVKVHYTLPVKFKLN